MKNALCCFLLLVLGFGACFHLLFVAFCCSSLLFLVFEIESIISQKPKQANAFCCSLWVFVAHFGFLWMFPFEHRIARCGFLLVRKTKTRNKRQKSPNGNQALTRDLSDPIYFISKDSSIWQGKLGCPLGILLLIVLYTLDNQAYDFC